MDHNTRGTPTAQAAAAGSLANVAPSAIKQEPDGEGSMQSPLDSHWDEQEHARFMLGLEKFGGERTGDEWHKIAAFVQTRSLAEVRSHGQQYLGHLVQIHQLQQQHHAQQQQQDRMLRITRLGQSEQLHPNSQNDPNGTNSTSTSSDEARSIGDTQAFVKPALSMAKSNPLSVAAQSIANEMDAQAMRRQVDAQPQPVPKKATLSATNQAKLWNFHEDKVLETALASWQSGKPYSWPKIAAALPGKTAKDVRLRYEQLVEDVACIDTSGALKHPMQSSNGPTPSLEVAGSLTPQGQSQVSGRPPQHSGLSSRIAPPPPIQVPPPLSVRGKASSGLIESPGVFPTSTRGRFAMTPSFGGISGMLSPTFLEFLASEDKPTLPFSGLTDLPSPLLPSPTIGLGSFTRGTGSDASAQMGPLTSPLAFDLHTPGATRARRRLVTPRGQATPRIWHEFLADELRLEPKSAEPSQSRLSSGNASANTNTNSNASAASDDASTESTTNQQRRENRSQVPGKVVNSSGEDGLAAE